MTDPLPRTLGELLRHRARTHAGRTFVHCGGRDITYDEFDVEVSRVAAGLARLGVGRSDPVAIALPNRTEFLTAWFALARLGAVEVPISLETRATGVRYILADSGSTVLVTDAAFYIEHRETIDASGVGQLVMCGPPPAVTGPALTAPALTDYEQLRAEPPLGDPPPVQPEDPLAIIYTSGTTGEPKGVLLCHEHEVTLGENIARSVELTSEDCFYNFFPLYHNTGQGIITGAVLIAGARMLLVERFSRTAFWPDVIAHGCTLFYGMGAIVEILNKDDEADRTSAGHRLRVGWGIAIGAGQVERFRERFGVSFVTGYGSTEANMVAISDAATPAGAAGRVVADFEVAVVDEHDRLLPSGQVGEIVVRPRRPFVTSLGYWHKERQTLEAWRNLWLHTGDAGTVAADGTLRFVDRVRDVIRHRGNSISSAEVENVILTLPEVDEVAVVPAPSDLGEYDEDVRAVIVARAGHTVDPARVVALCADELAYYAVPRYIDIVAELPKTPTGKVRKVELRQAAVPASRWDREQAGIQVRSTHRQRERT